MKNLLTFILLIVSVTSFGQTIKSNKILMASFAGKTKGEITKDELLNANELKLVGHIDSTYQIISFRLTRICRAWMVLTGFQKAIKLQRK